jgi:hypothetical protein
MLIKDDSPQVQILRLNPSINPSSVSGFIERPFPQSQGNAIAHRTQQGKCTA